MARDHPVIDSVSGRALTAQFVIRRGELLRTLAATARDDVPLIVLEAPAGFGKTTVLRQWAVEDPRPFIWVRLREVGGDLRRLLASIDLARQRTGRWSGAAPGYTSAAAVPFRWPGAAMAAAQKHVLVLDGPGGIAGPSGAALIDALITELPPQCQLAIASRDQLGLGRAAPPGGPRALYLGPDHLAFTSEETRLVLASAGVSGSDDLVGQLMQSTQGWPAAIGMGMQSLHERPEDAPTARLADDVRIVEYIRDEVLDRQSPAIRRFLLHTAVLDEMSGPLCDAVLDTSGSAAKLGEIEIRNLFIRRAENSRDRYRYNPLLADVLRAELRLRHPEQERAIRRRAVNWFAQHRQPQRAIVHSIAAGDLNTAARLVSGQAITMLDAGHLNTALCWFETLGEQMAGTFPPLGVSEAWVWAMAGNVSQALRCALLAERGAGSFEGALPDGSSSVVSGVAMARAALAPLGVERMLVDAERAMELEPAGTPWHATAALLLGNARLMNGDTDGAVAALEHSARLSRRPRPAVAQFGLAQLAVIAVHRGDWSRAARLAAASKTLMQVYRRQNHLPSMLTYVAGAAVAAVHADHQAARKDIDEATRLYEEQPPVSFPWLAGEVAIAIGSIRLSLGDLPAARSMAAAARGHVALLLTEGALSEQLRILQERLLGAEQSPSGPAVKVLSMAELRVLELLPTHLRLGEIGDQLHLSRNTVKSHVAAIHRKLGCSTRADAVRRARTLGLLPS